MAQALRVKKPYAKTENPVPYGTYTVKETVFPTNYHAYGKTEWTVTVDANNDGLVTINAVNEVDNGSAKIVKTSEDGIVEGVTFRLKGNGVDKTVTTDENGEVQIDDLKPGTYTVTETVFDKYEPQETRNVVVVSNQVATVTFNNVLKRGDLEVIKTSEDNLVEGVQFHLYGTSLSGLAVDEYAVTDKNGVATFKDVLISGHESYTLEEVDTAERYIVPDSQRTAIEWNIVTEKSFYNELKRGDLQVKKTSEDGFVQGMKFHLYGTSFSGIKVDEYATTDSNGIAYFNDILMGTGYTIEEVNTPIRYVIPDRQTADIAWDELTEVEFENILKKWRADVYKLDAELAGRSDDDEGGLVPVDLMPNVGGQPYWSWYGFDSRVEWCACFVSWCANECGYIDAGIIPKYAGCVNGVQWFRDRGQWADGSYEPSPGTIIFFDWEGDGVTDHTGIVQKCENGTVYTVEGNSGDTCRTKTYTVGSSVIYGYGIPAY